MNVGVPAGNVRFERAGRRVIPLVTPPATRAGILRAESGWA